MELKNCPFCGGKAKIKYISLDRRTLVVCSECGNKTKSFASAWFTDYTEDDCKRMAVEAWNRRY